MGYGAQMLTMIVFRCAQQVQIQSRRQAYQLCSRMALDVKLTAKDHTNSTDALLTRASLQICKHIRSTGHMDQRADQRQESYGGPQCFQSYGST
eukprot:6188945-Pleurochrysis_carterae.AAC.1